jgi:hypothetical protein
MKWLVAAGLRAIVLMFLMFLKKYSPPESYPILMRFCVEPREVMLKNFGNRVFAKNGRTIEHCFIIKDLGVEQ